MQIYFSKNGFHEAMLKNNILKQNLNLLEKTTDMQHFLIAVGLTGIL